MYTPSQFAEDDLDNLHDFIQKHSFATVISRDETEPVASHLPLLLDRSAGPRGQLIGHLARANSQWQTVAGQTVLSVFHGPHAYISPAWYEAKNIVPTWNYVAVHVYGKWVPDDSRESREEIARRYVDFYEADRDVPWRLDEPDDEFIDKLLDAIVCFRIDIERIEGKWKLSQNHDTTRRERVIRALREQGGEMPSNIAALMEQTLG